MFADEHLGKITRVGYNRTVLVAGLLLVLFVVLVAPLFSRSGGSRVAAAIGVAALGGIWLMVNSLVEGDILVTLAPERGITEGDIPSLIAFGLERHYALVQTAATLLFCALLALLPAWVGGSAYGWALLGADLLVLLLSGTVLACCRPGRAR